MIEVSYYALKSFATSRELSVQWLDADNNLYLHAFDGYFHLTCTLNQSLHIEECADFAANLQANGNKSLITKTALQTIPPFGSKTISINGINKNLFARFTGLQFYVNSGPNTLEYTATFPWVKMLGIETVGGVAGDTADLKVYDTAAGTYSGVPDLLLNQFAYSINVAPNFYNRMAQFDADLYQGMIVRITYNVAAAEVSGRYLGINLTMNEVKSQ